MSKVLWIKFVFSDEEWELARKGRLEKEIREDLFDDAVEEHNERVDFHLQELEKKEHKRTARFPRPPEQA